MVGKPLGRDEHRSAGAENDKLGLFRLNVTACHFFFLRVIWNKISDGNEMYHTLIILLMIKDQFIIIINSSSSSNICSSHNNL